MKVRDQILVVKAARKASRLEEIQLYGKHICWNNIIQDKTKYTRKIKHKKSNICG